MEYPRSWKVSSISQNIFISSLWICGFKQTSMPVKSHIDSPYFGSTLNSWWNPQWMDHKWCLHRISQVSFHVFPANRGSCFHGYVRHFAYHPARSRIRKVDVAATSSVPQRASSPSWCGPGGDGSHGVEWKKSCATRRMVECLWIMETIC